MMYAAGEVLYQIAPSGPASAVGPLSGGPMHGLAVDGESGTLYGIVTDNASSTLYYANPGSEHVGALPAVRIPVGDMRAFAFSPCS